jgi:hypothetical protein
MYQILSHSSLLIFAPFAHLVHHATTLPPMQCHSHHTPGPSPDIQEKPRVSRSARGRSSMVQGIMNMYEKGHPSVGLCIPTTSKGRKGGREFADVESTALLSLSNVRKENARRLLRMLGAATHMRSALKHLGGGLILVLLEVLHEEPAKLLHLALEVGSTVP